MQYTRYGTVVLAAFQAFGAAVAHPEPGGRPGANPGLQFLFIATVTMTTGTMFLMWLGEQITERGIGNGISMIIVAGIVARAAAARSATPSKWCSSGEMKARHRAADSSSW